jgi:hypothetical protein
MTTRCSLFVNKAFTKLSRRAAQHYNILIFSPPATILVGQTVSPVIAGFSRRGRATARPTQARMPVLQKMPA